MWEDQLEAAEAIVHLMNSTNCRDSKAHYLPVALLHPPTKDSHLVTRQQRWLQQLFDKADELNANLFVYERLFSTDLGDEPIYEHFIGLDLMRCETDHRKYRPFLGSYLQRPLRKAYHEHHVRASRTHSSRTRS